MQSGNRRAIIAALAANAGLAIAKAIAWLVTGSSSMLAESVHSLADSGNQALLLWGGSQAKREATDDHPFGHGQERYFWSFVVALVIFSLGGLFALYEGFSKLSHPHELSNTGVAVAVLVAGILMEGASFRLAVREARSLKGNASWWRFIRHTRNPELPVVLLEDLGALLGLLIALGGVVAARVTGNPVFDALGTLFIGALLFAIAVLLAIEMKSLLIGESASVEQQARIRSVLEAGAQVQRLIHLRTLHMGPDQLVVAAKLEFDGDLSFAALAEAINELEDRLREAIPIANLVFIEPDIYRSHTGPA